MGRIAAFDDVDDRSVGSPPLIRRSGARRLNPPPPRRPRYFGTSRSAGTTRDSPIHLEPLLGLFADPAAGAVGVFRLDRYIHARLMGGKRTAILARRFKGRFKECLRLGVTTDAFTLGCSIEPPARGPNPTLTQQRHPDKGVRGNKAMSVGGAAQAQRSFTLKPTRGDRLATPFWACWQAN